MKKINLNKEIGNNIVTRSIIDLMFSRLKAIRDRDITIDFAKVEFISRSAAHEYLKLKSSVNKNIKEINKSKDVKEMFEIANIKFIHKKQQNTNSLVIESLG